MAQEHKNKIEPIKKKGIEIIWKAAEYEHAPKDVSWYWLIGSGAFFLLLLALWQKNFFFAVFIILAAFLVIGFGKRRPQIIDFKVNDEGIEIGKKFIAYEGLEHFAVRSRPEHLDEIILKKKTAINPFVHVPIDSKLGEKVRALLLEKLPQEEHQESLVDLFSEWLGF